MTDLEHELAAAANSIPMSLGDVDKVTALGRRRRARRRGALSGVTALALVASIATLANVNHDAPTNVATFGAVTRGDVDLEWEVLSTSDGLGMSGSDVNGAGPFYALSTAAGRADVGKNRPSRVLWRSDDGVSWTAATTLGNDLFLSDLAPADGRVYAVGTAPAQAGVKRRGDLVAGWSDNGGKTFSKTTLPIDWAGIESGSATTQLLGTQIASSDKGTIVTATVHAALDVPRLLPQGAAAPDGWATTATGVDVLGPEKDKLECPAGTTPARDAKMVEARGTNRAGGIGPVEQADTRPKAREVDPEWCVTDDDKRESVMVTPQEQRGVVRSFTWSELGVTGDLLDAATRQLFGFFAPKDTTDFTRVDLGAVRADTAYVDADEDGFHIFASSNVAGSNTADTVDLSSEDGRIWTSIAGPREMQWVSAAGTVAGRRIVIGDSATGTLVARADGAGGWAVTPLSSVIDPALSGGRPVHSFSAGIGALGVVVAATPTVDDANQSAVAPTLLVFSRDGSTWEDQSVEQIAGRAVGVPLRIFVSGQRAVVSLSGGSTREGEAPKPQTILVGTPA